MSDGELSDGLRETLAVFETGLGEPLTTSEVTGRLDVSRRSTYERLDRLVDRDLLETKKVGAKGRVWWRPVDDPTGRPRADPGPSGPADGDRGPSGPDDAAQGPSDRTDADEGPSGPADADQSSPGRADADRGPSGQADAARDPPGRANAGLGPEDDNEELESFVEAVEEYAIFRMGADGRVRSWNAGAERIKGYEEDEILGEHFSRFYTEAAREARVPERNLAAAARDGSVEDEGWRVRADGSRFWANVTITAIRDDDGDLRGYTKVTRDMTDRREYERRLREERDLNEQLLETAPASIFVVDDDGGVERVNDRFRSQLGLEGASDLAVGDLAIYDGSGTPVPPEERPYRTVLRTGEPVFDWQGQVELSSGERRWVSLNAAPVTSAVESGDAGGDGPVGEPGGDGGSSGDGQPGKDGGSSGNGQRGIDGPSSGSNEADSDAASSGSGQAESDDGTSSDSEPRGHSGLRTDGDADVAGDVDRIVLAAQDVTHLRRQGRQLERQRDELEAELREVFDRVDDAFFALDEGWRFTHVNEQAATLLDRSVGDLVGRHIWAAFPAAVDTTFQRAFERAVDTQETVSFEEFYEPLETWLEVTAYPSESGLSVYFRDVTERKARERELERYETIVETVDDGIYVVDRDGCFTQVNDTYASMVGRSREELLGSHVSTVIDDEDVLRRAQALEAELAAGDRTTATLEAELTTPDGETRVGEATFALLPAADGFERVAVVRDVTDRKRFAQRLQRLNEASRDLLTAATEADVADAVTETIHAGFDLPGAVVYRYDAAADELVPASRSGAVANAGERHPTVPADDSTLTGRVFETGVTRYVPDVTESASLRVDPAETGMRTGSFVPLGEHGVLVVGARGVDAFDADTRRLVELLGATAEAALARVEHERELERRITQQDVVTGLGQRALEDRDLDALLAEAAERVAGTLDTDYCEVLELDEAGESLHLREGVGWRDGVVGEATVSARDDDSQAAYTLASSRPVVVEDLDAETRFNGPELLRSHDVRSGISVVVGPPEDPWGILGTHDTAVRPFTRHDVNFVQSVANILATAISRHADERALIRQREQLAALNSLNRVVREITDAVIDQSTREEIEATACEYLAATDSYEFAWVGEVDHTDQTVTVRTGAGVEGYLDDATISVDPDDDRSRGPTGRALRTGETQTTQDVREDARYEPWRERAEAYGFRSSAAVPIAHDGTTYGVLNVYADRPDAFTGRERTVVDQLGEVVGHAIAAIERKRALMTDEVVELSFHVPDVFAEFDVDPAEGAVTIDETVPLGDDAYLVYGTTTGDAHEVVTALVERLPHWESVTFHGDGPTAGDGTDADGEAETDADGEAETDADGEAGADAGTDGGGNAGTDGAADTDEPTTFELELTEPPVLSTVASVGGTIAEAAIEDGAYHMTVQVPPGAEVRQVIGTVQEAYPGAEMVTRRQTTRDAGPVAGAAGELADSLTDRQHAVLRAAYHAGFFEWPRKASGEDVADSLGVSAPTFHQHLRKAEQKVLDAVVPALG